MKVQFNNIPEGIRGKPLYCLAKLEQKPGKNKPDKIPYQITGARASPSVINKLVRGPNQLILCKITFIFKFFQFSIERLTKLELQVRKFFFVVHHLSKVESDMNLFELFDWLQFAPIQKGLYIFWVYLVYV